MATATPCREYPGTRNVNGYGTRDTKRHSSILVHSQIMEMAGHDIEGKSVMHKCDNRRASVTTTLRSGLTEQNMADKSRTGSAIKSGLTPADISAIKSSDATQRSLAARYGVTQATISRIKNNQLNYAQNGVI